MHSIVPFCAICNPKLSLYPILVLHLWYHPWYGHNNVIPPRYLFTNISYGKDVEFSEWELEYRYLSRFLLKEEKGDVVFWFPRDSDGNSDQILFWAGERSEAFRFLRNQFQIDIYINDFGPREGWISWKWRGNWLQSNNGFFRSSNRSCRFRKLVGRQTLLPCQITFLKLVCQLWMSSVYPAAMQNSVCLALPYNQSFS